MRNVMLFAVGALVLAALVPRYSMRAALAPSARATAPAPDDSASSSNSRSLTVRRGDNGHFSVSGAIDGRHMDFLVDTGASVIALRESEAGRLGIHPAAREYTAVVSTANGTVRGAPVELNRVEVGPLTVRDVRAIVLPDDALWQNLLGMSFLSRVRWEQQNGRLVLEQ
jgi:aspartyl protease family protein